MEKWTLHHPKPSQRMRYVVDVVWREWLGVEIEWVLGDSEHGSAQLDSRVALCWGGEAVVSWPCHPIMLDGTQPGPSSHVEWSCERLHTDRFGLMCLAMPCAVNDGKEGRQIDVLGALFYALTCWGEIGCARDEHGRPAPSSLPLSLQEHEPQFGDVIMSRGMQHRLPWAECFAVAWWEFWSHSIPRDRSVNARNAPRGLIWNPTFDVDVALKHRGRTWWKSHALQCRDFLSGRWSQCRERRRVLRGIEQDPFDTYGWIRRFHETESLSWYVLCSRRSHPYDVGLDAKGEFLPALVENLASHTEEGRVHWHPGYRAMSDPAVFQEEARMAVQMGLECTRVRAHFLRSEPEGWAALSMRSVVEDASLGWSREVGFRAGVSCPFPAYDWVHDKVLPMTIRPLAVMDMGLMECIRLFPQFAKVELPMMMDVVASIGGHWVSCWHNTTVSDDQAWKGWKSTYVHMAQELRQRVRCTLGHDRDGMA
ncbi:MAG: hypothetical protein O3B70_04150 [Bacteroidetes bacterium]|nr:hypothetical protein [Bacteroidota bacterium]MDA0903507.1 hypothetical protein [Bacteroidota bacterium]MDA1241908.1 hypothetical protein [Bacteroidota bacterium]